MPGRRLTHEDRRNIEAWLDEGLGFAEMGRRLGRPTSTVSREVMRNGSPGAYRADAADRTADARARSRRPGRATSPEIAEGTTEGGEVVEEIAASLAATGLPRMTARVFVSLLIADTDGRSAAELVDSLRVSPASVSKAIALLETMDLVTRHTEPGSRRERYVVDEDAWLRAWRSDAGAHAAVAEAARRGVETFGPDTPAGTRLAAMSRFFGRIHTQMSGDDLTEAALADALTVIAATVQAGRPVTVDVLSAALRWPRDRVTAAVDVIRAHPAVADPVTLRATAAGTLVATAAPDRLTPAQRAALRRSPSRE
ncbi:helix-turn-helix protein [Stackebrandtia albiflava]|uniref:Helix-turn-helix protein n=1 Tax=Stackebrandtia albiflava TaxID=406432 RepID=A0A562UQF1_9ACTN|nr:helix-turn-helix domain-containing protein [Stackebrandtia albiflava]TWJ07838.1 helix-turn-helix protein [Stackebrandtia albiflava]